MPDFTMESAAPRISSSLTLHPNLFQVFQPMGGVRARLVDGDLFSWAEITVDSSNNKVARANSFDRMIFFGRRPRLFYQNEWFVRKLFHLQKINRFSARFPKALSSATLRCHGLLVDSLAIRICQRCEQSLGLRFLRSSQTGG